MSENPGWARWRGNFDDALTGYIECALWSESCQGTARDFHADPGMCRGEDCDSSLSHDLNFGIDDLSPAAARDMEADLQGFVTSCLAERPEVFDGMTPDMVGHDFWLTRNGHGAGFWDRGLGERGTWLTDMSEPFGTAHLWVNNSGEVEYES